MKKWNRKCILCLLPSLMGILLFYGIPFARVIYYSLIHNQFDKKFVGLSNYADTLQNAYFILALKNSVLLILICVPILMIAAIMISIGTSFGLKKLQGIRAAFILPMLLPAAGVIVLWQQVFAGMDNEWPVYLVFIWKNIGICIILLTAEFTMIPDSLYEAARLDGAGFWQLHLCITIPVSAPGIVFTVLLSLVNTFRIYKESYLYYGGNYPPEYSYTLQYYMNNNFLKFDYQALSTGAVLTSVLIMGIVAVGLWWQRRYQ